MLYQKIAKIMSENKSFGFIFKSRGRKHCVKYLLERIMHFPKDAPWSFTLTSTLDKVDYLKGCLIKGKGTSTPKLIKNKKETKAARI